MSDINYIKLIDLLYLNPHNIEIIKQQYLLLLSSFYSIESIENELFRTNLERIHQMGMIVVGIVCDSSFNFEIVASGTVTIEPKLIHGGKNVGRIEDVVVAREFRGKGISRRIIDILTMFARENNCVSIKKRILPLHKNNP